MTKDEKMTKTMEQSEHWRGCSVPSVGNVQAKQASGRGLAMLRCRPFPVDLTPSPPGIRGRAGPQL